MAGHSKWANIQHRKGAQDAKRAKIFNKLSKEITVAAQLGGADVASNPSLRLAIIKAKAASMPKKNIENAVTKGGSGANKSSSSAFQEISYGGNVAGVSFLVVCLTDNLNRAASNIQFLFNRASGAVAGISSVKHIFDFMGVLEVSKSLVKVSEDEFMLQAIDADASNFEAADESYFIYTSPANFTHVKEQLEKMGITDFMTAEVRYIPNQEVLLPLEKAQAVLNLIDKLEDEEDVQTVFHNLDAASLG